jgi:signal transduction histidine kinase
MNSARLNELAMEILRKILAVVLLALSAAAACSHGPVSERSWVEDPTGTMTLAQVMAAPQQPMAGSYFGQGFSASAFWIRVRIDPAKWPDALPDKPLVIRLQPVFLDEFELHDPLAVTGTVRYTGDRHSWSLDDYQSLNSNFVVPRGSAPRDIWLRLQTVTSTFSSIEVMDLETARQKDFGQLIWSLVYQSVLLICMGWGALSWLSSRDRLVKLYVVREFFMIAYALVILGHWRALGAGFLPPEWIDTVGNWGMWAVAPVVIWFDIHFLSEFKPHPRLLKALYGFLLAFLCVFLAGVFGYAAWAFRIQAVLLTLCFFMLLLVAISTRIWSDANAQKKPVVSKAALIGFYVFVLLLGVFNRLNAMGAISSPLDIWSLLLLYPLLGSLMMMAVLQLRAQQQYKLQQQAEWRIALAEKVAQEEKSRRQEQQRFLAMLGHELRNPLSAVNFLADAGTPEGKQIRRAVQDMRQVIDRSVQAERLDDGGFSPRFAATQLPALVDEVVERANSERLQVLVKDLPASIETDSVLLSVVLANLVDNALKYSPENSAVSFHAGLLTGHQPPMVRFCVSNVVGIAGIPEKDRLFEKYYRSPAAGHQVGSGLGLYLVRGLVGSLGGTIDCRSSQGDGGPHLVFEVLLPIAPPASLAA